MCDIEKDCMSDVGIAVDGFIIDWSVPDAPGQPEKSLARHLCRIGFEQHEIVVMLRELRWREYLRAVSLGFGLRGQDVTGQTIITKIRHFYDAAVPAYKATERLRATWYKSVGL
jgi:hypothetical protein